MFEHATPTVTIKHLATAENVATHFVATLHHSNIKAVKAALSGTPCFNTIRRGGAPISNLRSRGTSLQIVGEVYLSEAAFEPIHGRVVTMNVPAPRMSLGNEGKRARARLFYLGDASPPLVMLTAPDPLVG